MPIIELKYGKGIIPFEYEEDRFFVIGKNSERPRLSDRQIGERLDSPIDSAGLEEMVKPGNSVLIVVPDATRQAAAGQAVNLVVRRLIANGTSPADIDILFATGIHRRVTEVERLDILTPFIAQRIKTIDHDPGDLAAIMRLGKTSSGISVELNRSLAEHDHVVIVGAVSFHYFAGFTGGRKLICPGLGSKRTILETHKLAFDCEQKNRREGVGTGLLQGNPVHEAFTEAASMVRISFCLNTIVNENGEMTDLYCGDWQTSHETACRAYREDHTISIDEKRPLVIVSCGGFPNDINLIQAHKALEAASHACSEGGTIILLADCAEGLGRKDLLKWFDCKNSRTLAEMLCENYQVNGQTAWSLFQIAEKFDVRIISRLSAEVSESLRLTPMQSLARAVSKVGSRTNGYIIPSGAKISVAAERSSF